MSIQRPTVQFNLVSGPPDLESFCRICMTGLSRWIFSLISASSMVASTEAPLSVPKVQHRLHIHVGTTDFSLFLITFYCTKLRRLVNYRALEVRIPIYNLINQSISLLYFFHSCMTHCPTRSRSPKIYIFFVSHPLPDLHDDVGSSPTMLVLSYVSQHMLCIEQEELA
jgi:hypothetical protein